MEYLLLLLGVVALATGFFLLLQQFGALPRHVPAGGLLLTFSGLLIIIGVLACAKRR
ncbi:MAG: hypothetical protein QW587_10805 [Candidatus Bathyarchaeia archaeon]